MGKHLKELLESIKSPLIKEVRGKGLFMSLELHKEKNMKTKIKVSGKDLSMILLQKGLISKATHESTIRLTPALTIKE